MQDAEAGEAFADLGRGHGRAVVAQGGAWQAALLERLGKAVRDHLGSLGQIPLKMAGEARAVVEDAEQDGRHPFAARLCGKSRGGKFLLKRRTRRDRMQAKIKEVAGELRRRMHQSIPEQGKWLKQVITGFFNYHAVPAGCGAKPDWCAISMTL